MRAGGKLFENGLNVPWESRGGRTKQISERKREQSNKKRGKRMSLQIRPRKGFLAFLPRKKGRGPVTL